MQIIKEITKFGALQVIPIFGTCTLLCGALIGFLITSGGLLLLATEGRNKTFIIPSLLLLGGIVYLYIKQQKTCSQKQCSTVVDKVIRMMLFMAISIVISIIFIIYVFIPWWIPNYQGGPLLP